VSEHVNVTEGLLAVHVIQFGDIDVVGPTLSYIVEMVFDAVLLFQAISVATLAATLVETVPCPEGVIVHLYTVELIAVKFEIVQLATETSLLIKL